MSEQQNYIPKIIHYCWFGGKPLPDNLKECLASWSILNGYTVMRWDESNCGFTENDFVQKAYAHQKWGFIGDYYRLKAVYEYGGIYLDTDVMVNKTFDPLLSHKAFLNFIFDCSVGTAIIGSQKGNPFIRGLMDMYDNTIIGMGYGNKPLEYKEGKYYTSNFAPASNYFFTCYILEHYPSFLLNNKYQDLGDFVIYPKEMFEIGRLDGRHYAIHLCDGSWRTNKVTPTGKGKFKSLLAKSPWLFDKARILARTIRYKRLKKSIPFYQYSNAQKKGIKLPIY